MSQTPSAPGNANAYFRSLAVSLGLNVNGLNDDGAAQVALAYLLANTTNPGAPIGAITIPTPGASEDVTMFYTTGGFTITQLRAVCVGSTPSVTYTIRFGSDRNATGTEVVTGGSTCTSTTTGDSITSFNSAVIPANSWVWLETTAQSGTVTNISINIFA